LTLLFLFTLFYASTYTACLLFFTFFFLVVVASANGGEQQLGPVGSFIKTGWNSAYLIFAALVIGIVQSSIIRSLDKASQPPKPRLLSPIEDINQTYREMQQTRRELADGEVGRMGHFQFNALRSLYGDDHLLWPLKSLGQEDWPLDRLGKPSGSKTTTSPSDSGQLHKFVRKVH